MSSSYLREDVSTSLFKRTLEDELQVEKVEIYFEYLRKEEIMRVDKINYYLDIAQTVAERGTCLRRNFGAIIVKNDAIIATGYNGAPRGRSNCVDIKRCTREELSIPRGQRYELCRSVHAEANCIISAPRQDMMGSYMYLVGLDMLLNDLADNIEPCSMCKRLIINAGI